MLCHTLSSISAPWYSTILITVTSLILNVYNITVSVAVWHTSALKMTILITKDRLLHIIFPSPLPVSCTDLCVDQSASSEHNGRLSGQEISCLFVTWGPLPFHKNRPLAPSHSQMNPATPSVYVLPSTWDTKLSQPFHCEGTILHTPKYETIMLGRNAWWHIVHLPVNSPLVFRIGEVR